MSNRTKSYYRDLFDSIPGYWQEIYSRDSFYGEHYRARRADIVARLALAGETNGKSILDVGCGSGGFFPDFLDLGLNVTGVDAAEGMIEEIRTRFSAVIEESRLVPMVGDIERLQFDDDSFDFVNCAGVLMYLPDANQALREMRRVLKKGGLAFLNTDNHRTIAHALDIPLLIKTRLRKNSAKATEPSSSNQHSEPSTRSYSPKQFRTMIEAAGFTIVDESGLGFGPVTLAGKRIFSDNFDRRLYKLFLPMFGNRTIGRTGFNYTVVASKD